MSSAAVAGQAPPAGAARLVLAVEGMTCAACAARVEKKLGEIAGVTANVNFATGIASVTAPAQMPLAPLIEAVGHAGYRASPARLAGDTAGEADGADAELVAYLKRRLLVALAFFVPLSDVSVLLSLFPAYRFPG